jgi:ATP-binding protein involved in chromosome partitioning
MFRKVNVPVLGIIENMSYFRPPDLPEGEDKKYYIFGQGGARRVADELGVDFLGEIPIDPRVVEGGDKGQPIVVSEPASEAAASFVALAGTVARKLAVLAEKTPPIADVNITWVASQDTSL